MDGLGRDERAWLEDRIRELIERHGFETYVAAPILEPTPRWFPDPYTPSLSGVRTVARRLLRYASLPEVVVEAYGADRQDDDPLAETLAVITSADDAVVRLAVGVIGPAEGVPLVLTHEVARAFHTLRRERTHGAHPYRSIGLEEGDEGPDEDEEETISLVACYLGFGLLVTKGAHQYRAQGGLEGTLAITRWVHSAVGALPPDEAAYVLAMQAVVRDVDPLTIDAWQKHLGLNQAAALRTFLEQLRPEADALRERLGLPPRSTWPKPTTLSIAPLPNDGWVPNEDLGDDEDEKEDAPAAYPVFRRGQHRGWGVALASGALTLVAVLVAQGHALSLLAAPVLALLGYHAGKRWAKADICSSCEATLSADRESCPDCGGSIRGSIRAHDSHLAAMERLDDVTAFGVQHTIEQTDADPRYVARGVKCPHCGWIPDGEAHWGCDECSGAPRFNTFEAGGQCPTCDKVFEETLCPSCEHLSSYEFWWPPDDDG